LRCSSANHGGLTPYEEPVYVLIPDDATRLYFGYLDTTVSSEENAPGYYGDNSGAHDLIIEIAP
jgi:hypothetical protein